MQSALRPYVTTGVALVGASLIAAGSVLPVEAAVSAAQERTIASMDVGLVASSTALKPGQSYANIIPNLFNAVLSVPRAEIDAINRFSAAMEASKSWWVYSDVNVLGWDPPNEEMTKGFVDMLLPFKPYSEQAGIATFLWFAANFPMNAGCSGFPPCPHPEDILSHMFTVAPWEFYTGDGYTFPDVINPISENETHWGQELGETGEKAPWSNTTWLLDPNAGWNATWDYLLNDPEPVDFPTGKEIWDTTVRVTSALWKSWYPFVPQSTLWNPQMSLSAYILRPFAPILCPDCNKADPFMPLDWKPGDSIPKGSYVPLKYKKNYDENGDWIGPKPGEEETSKSVGNALLAADTTTDVAAEVEEPTKDTSADAGKPAKKHDFLATAIQNLTDKFNQGKTQDAPAAEVEAGDKGDDKGTVGGDTKETPAPAAGETDGGTSAEDTAKPTKKWTFGGKHRKAEADAAGADSSTDAAPTKKAPKTPKREAGGTAGADGGSAKGGADKSDGGDSK
ncbi:MAG: hypothetical protein AB1925_10345 [Actinomycetota bacterium]